MSIKHCIHINLKMDLCATSAGKVHLCDRKVLIKTKNVFLLIHT